MLLSIAVAAPLAPTPIAAVPAPNAVIALPKFLTPWLGCLAATKAPRAAAGNPAAMAAVPVLSAAEAASESSKCPSSLAIAGASALIISEPSCGSVCIAVPKSNPSW